MLRYWDTEPSVPGVVEVLKINQDVIEKKAGCPLRVKYVLDLRDFPGDPVQRKLVKDFQVIVQDPDVKIVAEAMGGLHPPTNLSGPLWRRERASPLPIRNW